MWLLVVNCIRKVVWVRHVSVTLTSQQAEHAVSRQTKRVRRTYTKFNLSCRNPTSKLSLNIMLGYGSNLIYRFLTRFVVNLTQPTSYSDSQLPITHYQLIIIK